MKIKTEHYNYMFMAVMGLGKPQIISIRDDVEQNPKVKDVEKAFRWALIHVAIPSKWICDNLYSYANDDHIDTALKAVVKNLNMGF